VKVEKTLVIDTQYLIISCIFTKENEGRGKKKTHTYQNSKWVVNDTMLTETWQKRAMNNGGGETVHLGTFL
jgi:hypothetical protein